jgi:hypothetical protein
VQDIVEPGHPFGADDVEDGFYRFRLEHARDLGGCRAHHAELAFSVIEAVGPLVDIGVDGGPRQWFGLL